MKITYALLLLSLIQFVFPQKPRVFLLEADSLVSIRESIAAGNKMYTPAFNKLMKDAEKALKAEPLSVTTKELLPPSGDSHDYFSQSRYWWPDPNKPDGKPYIRKDGETNPEVETITDHTYLGKTVSTINTLALAFYYSGDEKYAQYASTLIRVWFLDTETKMNPNLTYAQTIPGKPEPRGTGILDAREFSTLVDAFGILKLSRSWDIKDQKQVTEWFTEYLRWLRESKNGLHESNAQNNHGTWYDVQTTAIALFVGNKTLAKQICEEAKSKRIAYQITPEGKQPEELVRTLSFHYSTFNLFALTRLATLANHVGIDLWNYKTDDNRSIRTALDHLIPYAMKEKKWEWTQIKDLNPNYLVLVARSSSSVFGEKKYAKVWEQLFNGTKESDRMILQQGFVSSRN